MWLPSRQVLHGRAGRLSTGRDLQVEAGCASVGRTDLADERQSPPGLHPGLLERMLADCYAFCPTVLTHRPAAPRAALSLRAPLRAHQVQEESVMPNLRDANLSGSNLSGRRADMCIDLKDDPREDCPTLGDERTTLVEVLRSVRLTLEIKCADLDAEAMARRSVEPSTMSLLGL